MKARVLAIGGSDSGAGAGIQADIKAVMALGGYAMTAVTAVTVQSTHGISAVHDIPPSIIRGQIEACLSDIGADAIKTGMLGHLAVVELIVSCLESLETAPPLVIDPVLSASDGRKLLDDSAIAELLDRLVPHAQLVTPNVPEAEILTGLTIQSRDDMERAATQLLSSGVGAVLLKGGHLSGSIVYDLLLTRPTTVWFEHDRIDTRHTHGTGCTLASAAATGLAQGLNVIAAVERARLYVQEALKQAPGLGVGHGPLEHGHTVRPFP